MRHQQTAEWFTIELATPMILAMALLLALIVEWACAALGVAKRPVIALSEHILKALIQLY
jgi:hypothetical protein